MRRKYNKPPIVEVVCELIFEPSQPWDWTIPGMLYSAVKENYPKKKQKNSLKLEFKTGLEQVPQNVSGGIERMQFYKDDETALIQIGPNNLSINHLKPYPDWEVYSQMIKEAYDEYTKISAPKFINRIGLRYINRIETGLKRVEIEDYLLAVPQIPKTMPQLYINWLQKTEIPYTENNGILILQSGSIHEHDNNVTFLLDLDFITQQDHKIELANAIKWIEKAHEIIEISFEACITDEARKLFNEER